MSRYVFPVTVQPDGIGGYIASFKDVPEALTCADTIDELKVMALDALITSIDFYIEDQRTFPSPSPAEEGDFTVELPVSVVAKVLLLNLMVAKKVRQAELARMLGVSRQEMTRVTDLHHKTKIDTIAKAIYSLGGRLELSVAS